MLALPNSSGFPLRRRWECFLCGKKSETDIWLPRRLIMTKTMWSPHPAPLLPCHIAIHYVVQTPCSYMCPCCWILTNRIGQRSAVYSTCSQSMKTSQRCSAGWTEYDPQDEPEHHRLMMVTPQKERARALNYHLKESFKTRNDLTEDWQKWEINLYRVKPLDLSAAASSFTLTNIHALENIFIHIRQVPLYY